MCGWAGQTDEDMKGSSSKPLAQSNGELCWATNPQQLAFSPGDRRLIEVGPDTRAANMSPGMNKGSTGSNDVSSKVLA